MNTIAFICLFSTIYGEQVLQNSVTLSTSNIVDSGASVQIIDPGDTVNDGNDWVITESSRTSGTMGLALDLDNQWGFDPAGISTLKITIDGQTPIGVGDRDMMVTFSVGASKFFTVGLRMDNNADGRGVYSHISACDTADSPTQSLFSGDINALVNDGSSAHRWHKGQAGNANLQPLYPNNEQWPLIFTLVNDPINNQLFMTYQGIQTQQCGFGEAFDTNEGLQLYFAGDNAGEVHTLSSFEIEYYTEDEEGFIYVPTPMTFGAAQAYCVSEYNSNLATVQRDDRNEANNDIFYSGIETWIGLYSNGDGGNFIWRNGDECEYPSPGTCVDFWGTPEENGINVPLCVTDGSGNKCVYYSEETELVYNDLDCEAERPFLCQEDNTMSPPDPDVSFVGSCNTGGCSVEVSDTCNQNGKITLTCDEAELSFDETTDAINSCIDIPTSLIPASISVQDVILSTEFEHTWIGDLELFLQKGSNQVVLFGDSAEQGCCGCAGSGVNVRFSDDAARPGSDGNVCADTVFGAYGLGGDIQSKETLSIFDGDTAAGRWVFYVYDHIGADMGTFGTWSLELTLSECPITPSAQSISGNNDDFMGFIKGNNDKYAFIEFIGLNIIISILTSVLVIGMVYCICCRKASNKAKGYGMIDPELNEDEDELPIKENL